MNKKMMFQNRAPAINSHLIQDNLETGLLKLRSKLEMIEKVSKVTQMVHDPQLNQQILQQREEVAADIKALQQKFGVSIFDIYSRIDSELLKGQILSNRDNLAKRQQDGKEDTIVDLYDEDGQLLQRGVDKDDIPDEYQEGLKRSEELQTAVNEAQRQSILQKHHDGLEEDERPSYVFKRPHNKYALYPEEQQKAKQIADHQYEEHLATIRHHKDKLKSQIAQKILGGIRESGQRAQHAREQEIMRQEQAAAYEDAIRNEQEAIRDRVAASIHKAEPDIPQQEAKKVINDILDEISRKGSLVNKAVMNLPLRANNLKGMQLYVKSTNDKIDDILKHPTVQHAIDERVKQLLPRITAMHIIDATENVLQRSLSRSKSVAEKKGSMPSLRRVREEEESPSRQEEHKIPKYTGQPKQVDYGQLQDELSDVKKWDQSVVYEKARQVFTSNLTDDQKETLMSNIVKGYNKKKVESGRINLQRVINAASSADKTKLRKGK